MPSMGSRLIIGELVLDRLLMDQANAFLGDPQNRAFYFLGALGGALGDFLPARPETGQAEPNTPYARIWLSILRPIAGTPARPGFLESLRDLRGKLGALRDIMNTLEPARTLRLPEARDVAKEAQQIEQRLKADIATIQGLLGPVRALILTESRPRGGKLAPSRRWRPRDTLHGSATGPFLRALIQRLEQRNDPRLRAFARGSVVGYAAALCGSSFLNDVVGAPYRNEWWRHRWIACHVDTWAWGLYALRRAGRAVPFSSYVPTPLYEFWPQIREAKLHERLTIGGITADAVLNAVKNSTATPAVLPQTLLDDWLGAYGQAYGAPEPGSGIDPPGLQSAYAMLWLVLWLQTSGEALPVVPRAKQVTNCGDRPEWVAVDGSVVVGGQTMQPAPEPVQSPSTIETVCAILLAILGGLTWAFGYIVHGLVMLALAVNEVAPDWDKVRCHLEWIDVLMDNFTNELHHLLELVGLGYPYTERLKHDAIELVVAGKTSSLDAAIVTARMGWRSTFDFPAPVWIAAGASNPRPWTDPVGGLEPPRQYAYRTEPAEGWPTHFVDGLEPPIAAANVQNPPPPTQMNPLMLTPLGVPLVRDADAFESLFERVQMEFAVGDLHLGGPGGAFASSKLFGNAVDVALDLLSNPQAELLSWDLDNDRGCSFPTWRRPSDGAAMDQIVPE